jgi:hypothetical protein
VFRPHGYQGKRAIYRQPKNLEIARWLGPRLVKTAAGKMVKRSEVTHWRVGLRRSDQPLYAQPDPGLTGFQWIESPRGHFWADPFVIQEGGRDWLFFEDFIYAQKRGVIACGRLENGKIVDSRTVLERPYHLSYPHLIRHEGAIWMIPETAEAGQVQLYRARKFPDEWVLERTLLELPAADCSPFAYEGRWYMFVSPNIVANVNVATTLLFEAPTLQGPWKLHPAGAICNDVRWARCAGAVIHDGSRLLRPTQDGSNGYGYAVSFNEFRLSSTTYEEHQVAVLKPDPVKYGIFGTHTYNRTGQWEVIDGRARVPRDEVA